MFATGHSSREVYFESGERAIAASGFGPISVGHYSYLVQLPEPPELPQAPGYRTCSQSVQMNSFTHDQGGEYDLLTPSGEKGKVYAHKNDIPEHNP